MKRTRLVLAVMTLFAGNMNAGTEEQQIVDTVSTIFAAALTDDVAKFARIGLPRKTGRQLEDRLHAQHPRSHDASREPWEMKSKFSSSARLGSPVIGCQRGAQTSMNRWLVRVSAIRPRQVQEKSLRS